jgi:hypothetical protein
MKSKNYPGSALAAPATAECRKSVASTESRRDYLRALRAAEMAAWEAADRPAPEAQETSRSEPRNLSGELSSVLVCRDRWEVALIAVVAAVALVSLLANLGALSHFVSGWTHFAGLVERILS